MQIFSHRPPTDATRRQVVDGRVEESGFVGIADWYAAASTQEGGLDYQGHVYQIQGDPQIWSDFQTNGSTKWLKTAAREADIEVEQGF